MEMLTEVPNPQPCLFDKFCSDISIDVTITYDDMGKWLADQFRFYFRIPDEVEVNYEISSEHDLVCKIITSYGHITGGLINLTYEFMNDDTDENSLILISEIAHLGCLIEPGFRIEEVKYNERDDPDDKSITYTLCGDLSVVSNESMEHSVSIDKEIVLGSTNELTTEEQILLSEMNYLRFLGLEYLRTQT